jgi:hypothetical protein
MKQRKVIRLVQARNERKAKDAQYIRHCMHGSVRSVSAMHGDNLSGYVMVSWDRAGEVQSNVCVGHGPFGWGRLPGECRDAVSRHIAIVVANPNADTSEDEPEGA